MGRRQKPIPIEPTKPSDNASEQELHIYNLELRHYHKICYARAYYSSHKKPSGNKLLIQSLHKTIDEQAKIIEELNTKLNTVKLSS